MNILLISTYSLGHQPLALASPAAHLRAAGHSVRCVDLALDSLPTAEIQWAEFVGLAAPMHTALRLGLRVLKRVRTLNRRAHRCVYGLYAGLNAAMLVERAADSVIGGEYEQGLVALVEALATGAPVPEHVTTAGHVAEPFLGRQVLRVPARDLLPPLERYVRLDDGTRQKLVGYVEATRGCAHTCLHCPITPVYAGRVRITAAEVVLQDIAALVELGAEHITFGDPDFFNGIKHTLGIVRQMHAAHPALTFDATIKVEHLLEHRTHLAELRTLGCAFVLSAVESLSDTVLQALEKGHSAEDVYTALALTRAAGLPLRPTFVAFTPWTTLEDYLALLTFIEAEALWEHVDPVQYAIRLLVPPGSALLGTPALAPYLDEYRAEALMHAWHGADARMDALWPEVSAAVEAGVRSGAAASAVFSAVYALAARAAGWAVRAPVPAGVRPPRLTEDWFC